MECYTPYSLSPDGLCPDWITTISLCPNAISLCVNWLYYVLDEQMFVLQLNAEKNWIRANLWIAGVRLVFVLRRFV